MNPLGSGPADRKTPEELLSLASKLERRQFQAWMPAAARPDAVQEGALAGWQACNRCRFESCLKDRCGFVLVQMQAAMLQFWRHEDFLSRLHRWEVTNGIAACQNISLDSLQFSTKDRLLPVAESYAEDEIQMIVTEERMNFCATTTPEKIHEIQELAGQGMSTPRIAKQVGVGEPTVRKYRGLVSPPHKTNPEKVRQIRQLFAQGVSTAVIAKQVGVGTTTVKRYRYLGENSTDGQADPVPSNGDGQAATALRPKPMVSKVAANGPLTAPQTWTRSSDCLPTAGGVCP